MKPALLAENLAAKGQGKSAAEVLDTGQTLALEEQRLSVEDFQILSKGTGWHPKVITKLLAIGRDKRLVPLQKQLPSTYSAIYPFTTLSDAELNLAVSEGICRPDSASREILDWIKVKRLDGMDLPESIGFVGTSIEPLTKERKAALLGALQQTALTFGINLVEGAVSVTTRKATKASREAVGERLYQQLLKELNPVFAIVSDEIRKEFELNVNRFLFIPFIVLTIISNGPYDKNISCSDIPTIFAVITVFCNGLHNVAKNLTLYVGQHIGSSGIIIPSLIISISCILTMNP